MRYYGKTAVIPAYPEFKNLELADRAMLQKQLARSAHQICELALANLYIWQDYDRPQLTMINNNLCVLIRPPGGERFFLEPLGDSQPAETTEICLTHAGVLSRLSMKFVASLDHRRYRVKCLRDHSDYIYLTRELAELKGRQFDGKRNHIKNFQKRHPGYEFVPLQAGHRIEALAVFENWFEERKDTQYFSRLAYAAQKDALIKAFASFDLLKLIGGALLIDGAMRGFILGSQLNPEMASLHFQYVEPHYRGITQTILWEACRKTFADFKHVNLEQDLSIPGLRKAKLSYHPFKVEKKFEIRK